MTHGWKYRTAYFQDFDNSYYKITLSTGKGNRGYTAYNIGRLEKSPFPIISGSDILADRAEERTSYSGTIPREFENVKEKFIPLEEESKERKATKTIEEAETGKEATIEVFHGRGKTRGEIYTNNQFPVAGEGKYYAVSERAAKIYGDEIEAGTVTVNKPLVIRDDSEWSALIKRAGNKYANLPPFLGGGAADCDCRLEKMGQRLEKWLPVDVDKNRRFKEFLNSKAPPAYLVILACMVPIMPNGLIPLFASKLDISVKDYTLSVWAGTIINVALCCAVGNRIIQGDWLIACLFVAILVGVFLAMWFFRGKVLEIFYRLSKKK